MPPPDLLSERAYITPGYKNNDGLYLLYCPLRFLELADSKCYPPDLLSERGIYNAAIKPNAIAVAPEGAKGEIENGSLLTIFQTCALQVHRTATDIAEAKQ